jgi:hypothetical protein
VSPADLEDNPKTPRSGYVSPAALGAAEGGLVGGLAYIGGVTTAGLIALAGGPLTAVILGTALVGGGAGLLGTGLATLLGLHRAADFDEQIARGGLLLWVRTWTHPDEARAIDILTRHSGRDVHVHGLTEAANHRPNV